MQPANRMDDDVMPKVDLKRDAGRLNTTEVACMKQAEALNIERALKVKHWRKVNSIAGVSLAIGVCGIYFYTMYSVKQETFLDDFNEPEKIIEKPIVNSATL